METELLVVQARMILAERDIGKALKKYYDSTCFIMMKEKAS
jgi:hypothetical protein